MKKIKNNFKINRKRNLTSWYETSYYQGTNSVLESYKVENLQIRDLVNLEGIILVDLLYWYYFYVFFFFMRIFLIS